MVTQQFLMKPVCMFVVYANNSVGEVNVLALTSPLGAIEPSSLKAFWLKNASILRKSISPTDVHFMQCFSQKKYRQL